MPAKGKNGTEAVADMIYTWAVAKFGNAHVDSMFCDRIGHLLEVKYLELKLAEYLVKKCRKPRKPFSFWHAVDIKALHVKKSTSEQD